MSSFIHSFKRATVGLLCLVLLSSLMFIGTEVEAGSEPIRKIEIKTDRALHQYTDIAAFLKGAKLIYPKKSVVKKFNFYMIYDDKERNELYIIEKGKAKPGKYECWVEIELKPGYHFDNDSNVTATLNGKRLDWWQANSYFNNQQGQGARVLTALRRYKVTFKTAGGTPVPPVQWVIEGQKPKVPKQPVKTGYTFLGWWHDVPRFSEKWNFNEQLYQDLPLIAEWEPIPTKKTTTTTKKTTTTTKKTTTTATTTPLITETTTPLPEEPTTTTTEMIEPTTTEATIELTTTSEAVEPDVSYSEHDDWWIKSTDEKSGGGGFSLTTFLFTIGGVIVLAGFGILMYMLGRRKK
ncbi:MAG TPA: InlB B-repeat-containing protein [Clostridiaceae bacterium]|jgi:uncharacterized repeat protein (TIGR02543 family)|nr:InlB B-repeat-containing protein [Clostridiaceae bacterium]